MLGEGFPQEKRKSWSEPDMLTVLVFGRAGADADAKTRALLSQALIHAAGQTRKTKHPLERAKQIQAVTNAAAKLHSWETVKGEVSGTMRHVIASEEAARRLEIIRERRAKARVIDG